MASSNGNSAAAAKALEALLAAHHLRYAEAAELCITRHRQGRGFSYRDARGRVVRERDAIVRFRQLAIPPAWEQVRLAPDACWHLQALGRDALGREQRRYHDAWTEVRDHDKLGRLVRFSRVLSRVRACVARDLRKPLHDPDALCAAAVRLVDLAHLRPGSQASLELLGSRGATTLAPANVRLDGSDIRLAFKGKSGKWIEVGIDDAVLARRLSRLKEGNRRRLFRIERAGESFDLSCADLNAYLQRVSRAAISAKDFRTHDATAVALWQLAGTELPASSRARQRVLASVAREVAKRLHNTPAIARASYIHPAVPQAWLAGEFDGERGRVLRSARSSRLGSRAESALRKFLAAA
jgi:DNA topoisomerase-1